MSQMTSNPGNSTNQKKYNTPKLRKFGNVSDLTLTGPGAPGDPTDGGGGFSQYAS
ncbi:MULTISPECIES: lasso RiPP family leader peptide-containing protein [unclassified Roseofilum]|uniref:lasso RiPP family leader peptide-containing protein n=1 Tax=unclassified Roseofilum TaxID=2620099 RepID=UPI001B0A9228|nr:MULTISPECIES: lasso RiPP family leader peptide-containing protein [unclassified Roseofilum]MBP0007981.1 lasso RiPP family leader peptide-containing protein [Roseofilum sp. Belize Diploria]MBP0032373.1 lasso RiPP family leader peptide-containing protein [Roseofilum sp. Belize BBD 4]